MPVGNPRRLQQLFNSFSMAMSSNEKGLSHVASFNLHMITFVCLFITLPKHSGSVEAALLSC